MWQIIKNKFVVILICLFSTTFCLAIDGGVKQNGWLSVDGVSIVNQHNEKIVLHGASLGWHNWWPRFFNKNTIQWLKKDFGCDVVRVPIGVEPDGAYLTNPEFALKCATTAIDAAIKNNMYVIIDWHAHDMHTEEAIKFFSLIVNRYKDCPNLIYEIFNEPTNLTWVEIKESSEVIIKYLRDSGVKNIILVGTPNWDQDVDIAADNPIRGYDNIMYTLHFYAATHKQPLRDKADYALSKGLPIFVSECAGMEASGDGAVDKESWENWVEWMNANNLSWVVWSISDKDETCSMIQNTKSPISKWKDSDLKDWGKIARNALRK